MTTIFPFRITSKINVGRRGDNTYHIFISEVGLNPKAGLGATGSESDLIEVLSVLLLNH